MYKNNGMILVWILPILCFDIHSSKDTNEKHYSFNVGPLATLIKCSFNDETISAANAYFTLSFVEIFLNDI